MLRKQRRNKFYGAASTEHRATTEHEWLQICVDIFQGYFFLIIIYMYMDAIDGVYKNLEKEYELKSKTEKFRCHQYLFLYSLLYIFTCIVK